MESTYTNYIKKRINLSFGSNNRITVFSSYFRQLILTGRKKGYSFLFRLRKFVKTNCKIYYNLLRDKCDEYRIFSVFGK